MNDCFAWSAPLESGFLNRHRDQELRPVRGDEMQIAHYSEGWTPTVMSFMKNCLAGKVRAGLLVLGIASVCILTCAAAVDSAPVVEEQQVDEKRSEDTPPELGGESSVRPGINQDYLAPNLDVDQYVQRFEIESREVYAARERILAASEIEAGDTVADVGAGTGLFTCLFSLQVGDRGWVYAIDIAPRFLEHINQAATIQKLTNITSVLCAQNSINLPPDSVDVVFICDTYHHFEYPKSTLRSIHQALKSDGRLILIDFDRVEGKSREWLLGHVRAGKEVFQAEIQNAGFSLEQEKKIAGFEENYFLMFRKK